MRELDWRKLSAEELMLLDCGVGEDSWESLGLQGDPSNQSILKEISPGISLEGMMLKLKLQYLATSCEELTHWKRLWCWEGLGAEREGDYRGWDGWMASRTRWTWVWVNSGRWWWIGRPGVLWFMGLQRVGHDWAAELNYPLTWREGYHTALQSIIFTLSLCHQEVHHVQKCNKSLFDWWDGLWTFESVFSEYNSQKQLWKYLKVLSSFSLTSWLILNKLFLSFFNWWTWRGAR